MRSTAGESASPISGSDDGMSEPFIIWESEYLGIIDEGCGM